MNCFKRNQIEEAISRLFGEKSEKPTSELRTRIKRLLETDRALKRNHRSADPEKANFAFFSSNPPGRGVEVQFSDYEAFALLIGLRLLRHGWPQSFSVKILRRLRPELEQQHGRILRQNPEQLFDQKAILAKAQPGDPYFDNSDPVVLTIASKDEAFDDSPRPCAVCRGMKEAWAFAKRENARSWSTHELVTPAHALASELAKIQPRKRGRSG